MARSKRRRVGAVRRLERRPSTPEPASEDTELPSLLGNDATRRVLATAESGFSGATSAQRLEEAVARHADRDRPNRAAGQPAPYVQRHLSFEHKLMGDVGPEEIEQAVGDLGKDKRRHLLQTELRRVRAMMEDPRANPLQLASRQGLEGIQNYRWVELGASGLYVSYGELNALADFLPNPGRYDRLPYDTIAPLVEEMRRVVERSLAREIGERQEAGPVSGPLESVGETLALSGATKGLGADEYRAVLNRNACHFVPFSWHRWARFHREARQAAGLAHDAGASGRAGTSSPAGQSMPASPDRTAESEEWARQAWVANGYADHFLQDSFAAGHLVNKTAVMAWFVEYLDTRRGEVRDRLRAQVPDLERITRLVRTAPGMTGADLYDHPVGEPVTGVTDPQTAMERPTRQGRIAGAGVSQRSYRDWLDFLEANFVQLAAKYVHDHFNEIGVDVKNRAGSRFTIGGDKTFLELSSPQGARTAAQAAAMSRDAIEQIVTTGSAEHTVEEIASLFPSHARMAVSFEGRPTTAYVPLEEWNDIRVRQLCVNVLFPEYVDSFAGRALRRFSRELETPLGPEDTGQ